MPRPYDGLGGRIDPAAPLDVRRRAFVDLIWDAHHDRGVSWVGFYVPDDTDPDRLLLDVRRDKPACSPIGLEGMCGLCFRTATAYVVEDVRSLGADYIACDPRDQSELVIPCMHAGSVAAVLDLDSYEVGAFDRSDVDSLHGLLVEANLTDASTIGCESR